MQVRNASPVSSKILKLPVKNHSLIHSRPISTFNGATRNHKPVTIQINPLNPSLRAKRRSQNKPISLSMHSCESNTSGICRTLRTSPRTSARRETAEYTKAIGELRKSLDKVMGENRKLKVLSREIMSSRGDGHGVVHSFYQNVILPESKQSVEELKEAVEKLKRGLSEAEAKSKKLKKENELLRGIVARYREIILNKRSLGSYREVLINDKPLETYKLNSARNQSSIRSATSNRDESGQLLSFMKSSTVFSKENVKLEMMAGSLRRLAQTSTIKELVSALYRELGILIKPCTAGIFIVNSELQNLYQQEKGTVQSITLNRLVVDFAFPGLSSYAMKPLFASMDKANTVIRKPDCISLPVNDLKHEADSEPYMIIQLENTHNSCKAPCEKEQWVILLIIIV